MVFGRKKTEKTLAEGERREAERRVELARLAQFAAQDEAREAAREQAAQREHPDTLVRRLAASPEPAHDAAAEAELAALAERVRRAAAPG